MGNTTSEEIIKLFYEGNENNNKYNKKMKQNVLKWFEYLERIKHERITTIGYR